MMALKQQKLTGEKNISQENALSDSNEPRTGTVQIRLAETPEDILAALMLGHDALKETPFHKRFPYTFDAEKRTEVWVSRMEERPGQYGILIADLSGVTIGTLFVQIGSHLHLDVPVAQVVSLFVLPENRSGLAATKLVRACEKWVRDKGAVSMAINVTSGVRMETTDRFLRRMKYRQTGGNYEIILNAGGIDDAVERSYEKTGRDEA